MRAIVLLTPGFLLLVACGGSVSPVDDGKAPAPSSTTPTTRPYSPPSTPASPPSAPTPEPSPNVPVPLVLASSYDQTCNTADDCVAMTELTDCGCACPSAAVNKGESAKVAAASRANRDACVANHAPACGADCIAPEVTCITEDGALVGQCRLLK